MCPHTCVGGGTGDGGALEKPRDSSHYRDVSSYYSYYYICVLILLILLYMCPHTCVGGGTGDGGACVSEDARFILLYICPHTTHTTIYVFSY